MGSADLNQRSLDDLSQDLAKLAREASPAIARLARWTLEHPQELAFQSVRGLAELSGANVNTTYRLARALGYSGYDECRRAFQSALRPSRGLYEARAEKLTKCSNVDLISDLRRAAHANLDEALSDENLPKIREAARLMLQARRIYCVGVRSCFSLAHYLSYTGGMAFGNFERPLVEPGSIADTLAHASSGDLVILITFSLYSAEVVRAHEAAVTQGVSVIAITDSYASPIAKGADLVFCVSMAGPQPLPSHGAGFALVEGIITEMVAMGENAAKRMADFERKMVRLGSYLKMD